jgi:S-adenosylmethionine:tRNA ribosyltransferase-isomerase
MEPKTIRIQDYHYDLPSEKIAKYPLEERDSSKLLIYKNEKISESLYASIDQYLPKNSLLFFNNTKVIPARLFFKTNTEKHIEIFCLEPISTLNDPYSELNQTSTSTWKCIVGGAAKWKEGTVNLIHHNLSIWAEKIEKINDVFIIKFTWEPADKTFAEVLEIAGSLPIPPYLKRSTETIDLLRYQTVYAQHAGSVAAPTAGLHFTDDLIKKIKSKPCNIKHLTLHVGAGTFKPVKSETMADHEMHQEYIDVDIQTINDLLSSLNECVIAVGTTSIRTLESLYWIGRKLYQNPDYQSKEINISQWEAYENIDITISKEEALNAIIIYLNKINSTRLYAKTGILIAPGYKFKLVNALITNFHQPESTLILLVAAFVGNNWREIYNYALNHNFRFLSYGDGSLLFRD